MSPSQYRQGLIGRCKPRRFYNQRSQKSSGSIGQGIAPQRSVPVSRVAARASLNKRRSLRMILRFRLLTDFQIGGELVFGGLIPKQLPDEPLVGGRKFQQRASQ